VPGYVGVGITAVSLKDAVGTSPSGDEVGFEVPWAAVSLETRVKLVAGLVTWITVVTELLGGGTSMDVTEEVGKIVGVVGTSGTLTIEVLGTETREDSEQLVVTVLPGQSVTLGGHEVTVTVELELVRLLTRLAFRSRM